MDCERFENTVLDELYGELDEVTSAASKRHAAGCSRCAGLLAGLRATRRVAVLPRVEPPPDLEARILEAAAEAQKVVPFRARVARVVSLAGSWAMRPQTAMAAVFLLMIGSSVLLMRGRARNSEAPAAAQMMVTEEGAPAAASAAPDQDGLGDLAAAKGAHGATAEGKVAAAPTATAMASAAPVDETTNELARADKQKAEEPLAMRARSMGPANAAAPAGAPVALGGAMDRDQAQASLPAAPPPAAQAAANVPTESRGGSDFATAMAAYQAKNFAQATTLFDRLAAAGDDDAALWAARSVRSSRGCAAAVSRFDQLSGRAFGKTAGYDATLEGGRCYRAMGSFEAARTRFARLLTVPAYAPRAQAEIDAMSPGAGAAGVRAAPRAATKSSSDKAVEPAQAY